MNHCLLVAKLGSRLAHPNPMVSALLVNHNNQIIAEGYHEEYGNAHAEVNAINKVRDSIVLNTCTLFVSLEPCSHFGKTPPCTDLIIRSGIKKVVVACLDPNPKVSGQGISKLKNAGIEVICGVLESEARFLNRRFITFHEKKRPYVILKWAESADGFFAPNNHQQLWLSCQESRELVHEWRCEEDAILVGTNTARIDNPLLTARPVSGGKFKDPLRIVLDRNNSLHSDLKIFNKEAPTLKFCATNSPITSSCETIQIDWSSNVMGSVLTDLYKRNITSVLVEGGAKTIHSFIDANYWDEARIFKTPNLLKDGIPAPHIENANYSETQIGRDKLRSCYNSIL